MVGTDCDVRAAVERPEEDAVDFLIAAREEAIYRERCAEACTEVVSPHGTSRQETRPGARSLLLWDSAKQEGHGHRDILTSACARAACIAWARLMVCKHRTHTSNVASDGATSSG